VIFGGLCDDYELPMMNIYACDEFIYACDDLCEYLRLLEKRKKRKSLRRSLALGEGAVCTGPWSLLRRETNP
jgi:hypothetical protein